MLPFCFCPHDVMSNAMTRAKRNIFFIGKQVYSYSFRYI
ncbi:hypothetical protein BACUNI_01199 [Bacteroides uniformis ATCC 8492]|uniref:Uncharacterized protein n=1 Tax=Bacteroides uniformis (strain ATCC 8492 / DSM 6597 / CCUG 4942 / CIP 103695 / JCM 5828 / KCTC 5204 / NCTC 13054 / VPI 0061) TaxID=411479 RepID=A0ABC9NEI8_BACUC|nr:hypothetical protein BACUNI_01199 [Bacteroides uniformis ATCC 8492]